MPARTHESRPHPEPAKRAWPAKWCAVILAALALLVWPVRGEAQSARNVILATATVAAEETYVAFDAAQEALAQRRMFATPSRRHRGIELVVRTEPPVDERARPARTVTVYFSAT
jgi:hypothetical protein